MCKRSLVFPLLFLPATVCAENLDSAATAWILTSAGLVLFMTLPGLALFYAGLVRTKNVLSVIMACFSITALVSILWVGVGYSLVFTDGGDWQWLIGGFSRVFLIGVDAEQIAHRLPESVFTMYHMTIAIIAPVLIVGSLVERVKFSSLLVFCSAWTLLVYVPVCHWIWGGGWLAKMGVMDFAGGLVVHTSAGVAALMGAVIAGPRRGFPNTPMIPHNLTMTTIGAGILWVGWHGFSAGSTLMANGAAGMAMLTTHMSASSAAMTWIFLDWMKFGKPSVLGMMTGMIAGLGAISAGAGYISPATAIVVGILASIACYYSIQFIKQRLLIDDSLDVFPVHGFSGVVGCLSTAVFADIAFGGTGVTSHSGIGGQLLVQSVGLLATIVWSAVLSYLIFRLIDMTMGLRVIDEHEIVGLDSSLHDQQGYNL